MKNLWILFVFAVFGWAYGKELHSFDEISKALMNGHRITMVVQIQPSKEAHSLSFFIEPNAVMMRPTYIQFADTHFTTNHPGLEKTALLENVTYKISEDGEVRITTRIITLPEHQLKGEHQITCTLGDSAKIYMED